MIWSALQSSILATHLQLDLYRIDLSGMVNNYIPETEKNLKRIFDGAQRPGSILFFDEVDALFAGSVAAVWTLSSWSPLHGQTRRLENTQRLDDTSRA